MSRKPKVHIVISEVENGFIVQIDPDRENNTAPATTQVAVTHEAALEIVRAAITPLQTTH